MCEYLTDLTLSSTGRWSVLAFSVVFSLQEEPWSLCPLQILPQRLSVEKGQVFIKEFQIAYGSLAFEPAWDPMMELNWVEGTIPRGWQLLPVFLQAFSSYRLLAASLLSLALGSFVSSTQNSCI